MHSTQESFQEVSDFCERHLEATRGREIGVTFGAVSPKLAHTTMPPHHTA